MCAYYTLERVNLPGLHQLHSKPIGFLLPLPFICHSPLSWAPHPKMDEFWFINPDHLGGGGGGGVHLCPTYHKCQVPENK